MGRPPKAPGGLPRFLGFRAEAPLYEALVARVSAEQTRDPKRSQSDVLRDIVAHALTSEEVRMSSNEKPPPFKPTASVQAVPQYTLRVSKEEMCLLCLALAGKLGTGSGPKAVDDLAAALALNRRLLKQAHDSLAAQLDSLQNALELAGAEDDEAHTAGDPQR